jgi:23S rRNA (pseudouridine1915-N3)-methyltransferase
LKIALIQTGKTTDRNILAVLEDYSSRIRKYIPFEIITIPDLKNTKSMPVLQQKNNEGKLIASVAGNDDYVILLDERGREFRTTEFSSHLEKMLMSAKKRIVFVIGGPWGFSDEVYARADMKMSLSKMTFPHQLVRLLFIEQLYRAFTIIKGEPYHHE